MFGFRRTVIFKLTTTGAAHDAVARVASNPLSVMPQVRVDLRAGWQFVKRLSCAHQFGICIVPMELVLGS